MGEPKASVRRAASAGEELPAPVSGQRHEFGSPVGRLTYYSAGADVDGGFPPLLLIHSINAAASAYEVRPLYERYRNSRTVYALELPGFGHSERGKREYTVRMMTDAILLMVKEIQNIHGRGPIDALAVSLSCEFLARAISEMPLAFRSAALVSPTGFSSKLKNAVARDSARGGTRKDTLAMPWLHGIFEVPLWSARFFRLLSSRPSIRFFLRKTWGSANIDEGLAEYDYLTTHQPGAQHAPYYFVSGYLFSKNIVTVYLLLTLPVWMTHGVRGDFVDYSDKSRVQDRANWTIEVFDTGAMPHFEENEAFVRSYDAFLARAAPLQHE